MRPSTILRGVVFALAVILASASIFYGCVWMYTVRHQQPNVEIGFDSQFSAQNHWMEVTQVYPNSPAERAGLKAGDRITVLDGRQVTSTKPFDEIWMKSSPGDAVNLTIERRGIAGALNLQCIFRATTPASSHEGLARTSAEQVTGSFPVFFLSVGLAVLFLRPEDRNAWLLALLFCAFIAAPDFPRIGHIGLDVRSVALAYRAVFLGMLAPLFYLFFALFPARSPLDRRFPWLKWAGIAAGLAIGTSGWREGHLALPPPAARMVGEHASDLIVLSFMYGFLALGLISLAWNAMRAPTEDDRRRIRYILWGTFAGVLPIAVERAAADFGLLQPSFWLENILVLILFIFPLSFGYAVVKHRVLEIPLLLKRSARYLLVRRGLTVIVLLVIAGVSAVFSAVFPRLFRMDANVAMAIGVGFGGMLAAASARPMRRATERVDRAFFRNAYDARVILERLAGSIRKATDREQISALLAKEIGEALHPTFTRVYFENGKGGLDSQLSTSGTKNAGSIPADLGIIRELAKWERPMNLSEAPAGAYGEDLRAFGAEKPEFLAPIPARDGMLAGIIALGPRISEEPYSREDERLLTSVATQAGIAVENIGLAERMAVRLEIEQRANHEMQIARQVQARLFPQTFPALATLEYAGKCIQTRQVGGDYYDFLGRADGRLGIVLADIAGKGISGALLMANLQANLRSQYGGAANDLAGLLKSVNRLFYENTTEDAYATMFFAEYEDRERRLRYVNCGHLAALLLRKNGELEKLESSTTVLGLFPDWDCCVSELQMQSGDMLLIYTDGVTEANNGNDDYGMERLAADLKAKRNLPMNELLDEIIEDVLKFSGGVQADDVTLVAARCR